MNYVLALYGIAVDDQEVEGDEGFILYFEFYQTLIHPDDYSRLQIGNAAILVIIDDNDIREYNMSTFVLVCITRLQIGIDIQCIVYL